MSKLRRIVWLLLFTCIVSLNCFGVHVFATETPKIEYDVVFVLGAHGQDIFVKTEHGRDIVLPNDPTSTIQYAEFDGWFTDTDCTTEWIPHACTSNETVYAKWVYRYPVYFKDLDGNIIKEDKVTSGDNVTIPDEYKDKILFYRELNDNAEDGFQINPNGDIVIGNPTIIDVYEKYFVNQYSLEGEPIEAIVIPITKVHKIFENYFKELTSECSYKTHNFSVEKTVENYNFKLWDFYGSSGMHTISLDDMNAGTYREQNYESWDIVFNDMTKKSSCILVPRFVTIIDKVYDEYIGYFNRHELEELRDTKYVVSVKVPANGKMVVPVTLVANKSLYNIINDVRDISDSKSINSVNLDENDSTQMVLTDIKKPTIVGEDHILNLYINRNVNIQTVNLFSGTSVGSATYFRWGTNKTYKPSSSSTYKVFAYTLMNNASSSGESSIGGTYQYTDTDTWNRKVKHTAYDMKRGTGNVYRYNAKAYVTDMPNIVVDYNGGRLKDSPVIKTSQVAYTLSSPMGVDCELVKKVNADGTIELSLPEQLTYTGISNIHSDSVYNPVYVEVDTAGTVGYKVTVDGKESQDIRCEFEDASAPSWMTYGKTYKLTPASADAVFNDFTVVKWFGISARDFAAMNFPIVSRTDSEGNAVVCTGYYTEKTGGTRVDNLPIDELRKLGDITVYAHYSDSMTDEDEKDVTVTYYKSDCKTVWKTITAKTGDVLPELDYKMDTVESLDHRFDGWFSSASFEEDTRWAGKKLTGDISLYPKLVEQVTVIYWFNDACDYLLGNDARYRNFKADIGSELTILDKPDIIDTDVFNWEGWKIDGKVVSGKYTVIDDGSGYIHIRAGVTPKEITCTFVLNNGEEDITQKYNYDDKVTPPIVKKDGFRFIDWYSDSEFNNKVYFNLYTVTRPTYTFYAKWADVVTITYKHDDVYHKGHSDYLGGDVFKEVDVDLGVVHTLENCPYDYDTDKYTWEGWYKEYYHENKVESGVFNEDTTLYAFMKPKNITVHYVTNCDLIVDDKVLQYGDNIPIDKLERRGFEFKNWYYNSDLSNVVVTDTKAIKLEYMLYAKWEKIEEVTTSKISFRTDCDIVLPDVIVDKGEIISIDNLTRENYELDGWYFNSDFSGDKWTPSFKFTEDEYILYAKWTPIVEWVTVTYNHNIDGMKNDTEKVVKGTSLSKLPAYTNGTKHLIGWFYDEEFTTKFDIRDVIDRDITLYAKWYDGKLNIVNYYVNGELWKAVQVVPGTMVPWYIYGDEEDTTGFVEEGWYKDEELTQRYYNAPSLDDILNLYLKLVPIVEDKPTVTYRWLDTICDVVKVDKGTVLTNLPRFRSNEVHVGLNSSVTTGWYYDKELNHEYDNSPIVDDTVLYASHKEVRSVTYYYGKTRLGNVEVDYNTEYTAHYDIPNLDRHEVLVGWRDNLDGEMFTTRVVTRFHILNAVVDWYCFVDFVTNNDGTTINQMKVKRGEVLNDIPQLTNGDKVFAGWYYDSSFNNKYNSTDSINDDITLYAKWIDKAEECVITMNRGFGICSPIVFKLPKGSVLGDGEFIFDDSADMTGYTLIGWFDSDGNMYTADTVIESDVELTGRWLVTVNEYFVAEDGTLLYDTHSVPLGSTFVLYDGEDTVNILGTYSDEACTKEIVEDEVIVNTPINIYYKVTGINEEKYVHVTYVSDYFDTIVVTQLKDKQRVTVQDVNFTSNEHVLEYWCTDKECLNRFDEASIIDHDITLYAKYKDSQELFTVTYKSPHHEDLSIPITLDNMRDVSVDNTYKSYKDSRFVGYYIDEECTQEFDDNSIITQDIILYVLYEEQVSFLFGDEERIEYVRYGECITDPGKPTYSNKTRGVVPNDNFLGWSTSDKVFNKYDFTLPVIDKLSLYAYYEDMADTGDTYRITYVYGYKGNKTSTVEAGKKLSVPSTDDCPGEVKAWYTDSKYKNKYNFDSEVHGNITLYAKVVCTVTFRFNNDNDEVKCVEVLYNNEVNEPDISRDGYSLSGWYINSKLNEKYNFDSKVVNNFNLYAKWDKNSASAISSTANSTSSNSNTTSKSGIELVAEQFDVGWEPTGLVGVTNPVIIGTTSSGTPIVIDTTTDKSIQKTITRLPQTGVDYLMTIAAEEGYVAYHDEYLELIDTKDLMDKAGCGDTLEAKQIRVLYSFSKNLQMVVITAIAGLALIIGIIKYKER